MQNNIIECKFEKLKEELIDQGFGPVKTTSNGYRCFCPCHDDTGRPNLDISIKDDKILMHCKSCNKKGLDVIKKLGLDSNILRGTGMDNVERFKNIWRKAFDDSPEGKMRLFAKKLNTRLLTLRKYGCFCESGTNNLCLPERDYENKIIGISVRSLDNKKWMLKKSKRGLFLPVNEKEKPHLFMTEGASDCLALSWLLKSHQSSRNNYQVIARPSKSTNNHESLLYVYRIQPVKIIICADIDDVAGIDGNGAESLACDLEHLGCDVNIIWPENGTKDVREWIQKGAKINEFLRRKNEK